MSGAELAAALIERDLRVAPAVLNLLESTRAADRQQAAALLAAISPSATGREAPGQIVGITGPPGVGKSTLLGALIAAWRANGRTVAALAVDPSSKRSGGSLLGDRARIEHDPADRSVLIRSAAAGERLGGVAAQTRNCAHALAVAFDVVAIETVGVGQSETEVATLADTVALVMQPGSGDTLQFLKAGIMETPDVVVVAKSDLGAPAKATLSDALAALRSLGASDTPALAVSAVPPTHGIAELIAALDAHRDGADRGARRLAARRAGALEDFIAAHGQEALSAIGGRRAAMRALRAQEAGLDVPGLTRELERALDK